MSMKNTTKAMLATRADLLQRKLENEKVLSESRLEAINAFSAEKKKLGDRISALAAEVGPLMEAQERQKKTISDLDCKLSVACNDLRLARQENSENQFQLKYRDIAIRELCRHVVEGGK